MIGQCANKKCNAQILDLTKKGQARFMDNYRDHFVELSNGTLMRVGVCVNCKALLVAGKKVQETADAILEKHKDYWREHIDEAPKGCEDWIITDPNTSEDKHLLKRREKSEREEGNLQTQKDAYEVERKKEIAKEKAQKEKK